MRKWLALLLVFALCACAPAWAEGVTSALGITGGGESSVRGDLSARTDTDLYVVTNEGSDKVLSLIHILEQICLSLCARRKLLPTAGSDCHGDFQDTQIGQTRTAMGKVPLELLGAS